MKIALCPGSFDPVTNGHIDIIKKSSRLFDKVIVAVCDNQNKNCLFTKKQRFEALKIVLSDLQNVEVISLDGLLADYIKANNISAIIKGLRTVSDFEYEFQMADINKKLFSSIETIFIMADPENRCISSNAIKQIVSLGGDISGFVPDYVFHQIKNLHEVKNNYES